MAKRVSKKLGKVLVTREDMEACVGEICRLAIRTDQLQAEMDERIRAVRAEYEEPLANVATDLAAETEMAKDWALRNPDAFGEKRSVELVHGTAGFRVGNPTLRTVRKLTWDDVVGLLEAARVTKFLRVKKEVDKEAILAKREELGEQWLNEFGLKVAQDERFFVEPRRDETADQVSGQVAAKVA